MCLKISCHAIKDNLVFPFLSFLFFFIAIYISEYSQFNEHIIIKNTFASIGNILSFIPLLFSLKLSRKSIDKTTSSNKYILSKSTNKSLKINYEYNDKLKEITQIKCYHLFFISFIDFLLLILIFAEYKICSSDNTKFLWSIDIICIYILSKIFLNITIYVHHIISLLLLCFIDIYLSYMIIFNQNFNYWKFALIIPIAFLFALKVIYAQKLINLHFISHFKLCFIIGSITFFYNIIALVIETFIEQQDHNLKENKYYKFLIDNGFEYWNTIKNIKDNKDLIKEIIFTIIYIVSFGLSNIFLLLTLNYLSPFHVLISKVLFCVGYNLSLIIKEKGKNLDTNSIINISIYGLSVFVLFIFVEIIQFSCCKLNINTKDKIQERSLDKANTLIASEKSINESLSISISCENNTRSSISYTNSIKNE